MLPSSQICSLAIWTLVLIYYSLLTDYPKLLCSADHTYHQKLPKSLLNGRVSLDLFVEISKCKIRHADWQKG